MQASLLELDVRLVRLVAMHVVRVLGPAAIVHRDRQCETVLPGVVIAARRLDPAEQLPCFQHNIVRAEDDGEQVAADAHVFDRPIGVGWKSQIQSEHRIRTVEREVVLPDRSGMVGSQMIVEPTNGQTNGAVVDATQEESGALDRCLMMGYSRGSGWWWWWWDLSYQTRVEDGGLGLGGWNAFCGRLEFLQLVDDLLECEVPCPEVDLSANWATFEVPAAGVAHRMALLALDDPIELFVANGAFQVVLQLAE